MCHVGFRQSDQVDRVALRALARSWLGCGMTGIRQAIDDYLAVHRTLGYKLEDHSWLLADLASFLEAANAVTVATRLALTWATLPRRSPTVLVRGPPANGPQLRALFAAQAAGP